MALSFEQFVESSSPRLVRTARMLLGSAVDSQDLAQETLLVMYRHWGRLRDAGAAQAYAYTTLVRLARRHLRRARYRYQLPHGDFLNESHDMAEVAPEHRTDLTDALALLPPRQREAVVLRYYLDLSIEDTARTMRCTAGTVKSQVSKALTSLKRHLEDRDQFKVGE